MPPLYDSAVRRLFTFFSALSLLLFVAVCVLWVRSYTKAETVNRFGERFQLSASSLDGTISLSCSDWAGPRIMRGLTRPGLGWSYRQSDASLFRRVGPNVPDAAG